MSKFNRIPDNDNIFELTSEEVIELTFRINEDEYEDSYDRNSPEGLRFKDIKKILNNHTRICYFQRQKEFEGILKETGEHRKYSNYKIIIPFETERAFEILVGIYLHDGYTFKINKSSHLKVNPFFQLPKKDFVQRNCLIKFRGLNDYNDFRSNENFKELINVLDSLNLPLIDINKEKDRKIWHHYVVALKKLVKQKEQVWKIKRIDSPKYESTGSNERAPYIDIYIDEGELTKQLQHDILEIFGEDELEDYGVGENKVFIEFKNYRELNQEELNQLKETGEELFYEISNSSPRHYISGEISFIYSDNISKEDIFLEIQSKLKSEYQFEVDIKKDGYLDLKENDIQHLQKIINDSYINLLLIHRDNLVQLKVEIDNDQDLDHFRAIVKEKLDSDGLNKSVVSILKENHTILIEVSTYIHPKKFLTEGLQFIQSISRFSPNRHIKGRPIVGLELADNIYQVTNASKDQIDDLLSLLQENFPGVQFSRKPTLYFFKPNQKVNIENLRNFKTKIDLPGKTEFDLTSSVLKISAESKIDYELQLKRVKVACPTVFIESKPYNPNFQILFKTDQIPQRQSLVNKIQNEIKRNINRKVEFDVIKNHTRCLFSYDFASEDERDKLKEVIAAACSPYLDILNFSFENNLGGTIYELFKNEKLEGEKERETRKNVFLATFVFLTPEEREVLSNTIASQGELVTFKGGITIGRLIKKEGDRLKFQLSDEFDDLINAPIEKRLDLNEIRKGFIKPIFPGELVNIDRMIRAMEKVVNPGGRSAYFISKSGNPYKIGYPVNPLLPNFLFDPNEARQTNADIESEKRRILANLNEPLLREQEKQLEAVAKSLLAKDLALIQGPPGTGKTTVIAEIIWQALLKEPNSKILITSQTNLAVDNALERVKGKKLVRPIRIGNIEKFEDEGKVYSNDRIKKWINAKTYSKDEEQSSDNAVCNWLVNIKAKCSEEVKFSNAITKWKRGLDEKNLLIKSTFSKAYYKYVNVFAATCSECGSRNFGETYQTIFQTNSERQVEPEFDIVIMDEASKATPPELVLPLTLGKKVIIIGDHKQLPPMIDEQEFSEALESIGAKDLIEQWTKDDYKVSQFEKLFKNAPESFVGSLDTQFRMHEQIMNCISQFYSNQAEFKNGLICGIKKEMDIPDFNIKGSRWHGLKLEPFINTNYHAIWVNVETPEAKVGKSYDNEGEVIAIQTILRLLIKNVSGFQDFINFFKKDEEKEIGIITYYVPQMLRIRNTLYSHFSKSDWRNFNLHKFENEFQIPFRINTVDRFQGMERNIIIISTVRSNKQFKEEKGNNVLVDNIRYPFALGFARELQRINVGFSRAKRLLIVVGNEKHFSHKSEYAEAIRKMHRVDMSQLQNLILK